MESASSFTNAHMSTHTHKHTNCPFVSVDSVYMDSTYHIEIMWSWALVARACNPSCSGGRDQEGHSSKSVVGK
jgi:hypothetical protein